MAFKPLAQYNEEKYGGMFRLQNDGDYADVIFLYQSVNDPVIADVHYIKSQDYSGYVHCLGNNCPCCAKGIRVQTKLFIPLFNITTGRVEFWDRTTKFEPQLQSDVFNNFPNPSEYIFRITRNGAAGDKNTRYQIIAMYNNTHKKYADILAENNIQFPDYYDNICKEVPAPTLTTWLNSFNGGNSNVGGSAPALADYVPIPRVSTNIAPTAIPELPDADEELDDGEIPF